MFTIVTRLNHTILKYNQVLKGITSHSRERFGLSAAHE